MAAGVANSPLGAWYANQVQPRSDGCLVRPLGRWSSVIRLPDEAVASRYVARHVLLTQGELAILVVVPALMIVGMFILLLDFETAPPFSSFAMVQPAILGVAAGASVLGRLLLYRWARRIGRRVPATEWQASPPPKDLPIALLPGWLVAFAIAGLSLGSLAVVGALARQSFLFGYLSVGHGIVLAFGVAGFWWLAVHIALVWWRGNRRAA